MLVSSTISIQPCGCTGYAEFYQFHRYRYRDTNTRYTYEVLVLLCLDSVDIIEYSYMYEFLAYRSISDIDNTPHCSKLLKIS